jgi:hypothetical protein
MKKRFEYKYLLNISDLEEVRNAIIPFLTVDNNATETGRNEYTVRSIYYDSLNFNSYFEKIEGIASRKKFRIRGYNELRENSKVFLEIKNKYNNAVSKNRALVRYSFLEKYLSNGTEYDSSVTGISEEDKIDAERFMFYYKSNKLRPTVLVVYEREAFMGKYDRSVRVTFDKNLRSRIRPEPDKLFDEADLIPSAGEHFILEFKFYDSIPSWFKFLVKKFNITRRALSKYTICIDTHIKSEMMQLNKYRAVSLISMKKKKPSFKRTFI